MKVDIESSDDENVHDAHATNSLPDAAIYADDDESPEPTKNADAIFDHSRDQHISAQMTDEAWPRFLSGDAIKHESDEVAKMQKFKSRCFDGEIRWRVHGPSKKNPLIENLLG